MATLMMPISTIARSAVSASFFSVSQHPSKWLKIDFQAIDHRLVHLAEAKSNKSYEHQKSSLHKELVNFLSSLPVPKALPSASPSDI